MVLHCSYYLNAQNLYKHYTLLFEDETKMQSDLVKAIQQFSTVLLCLVTGSKTALIHIKTTWSKFSNLDTQG